MATIRKMSGDGLRLYLATKESGMPDPEIFLKMNIGNTTYYQLFKKETLSDKIKNKAAKALGRPVNEIFGTYAEEDETQSEQISNNDYRDKYYALLEKNQQGQDIMIGMLKSIADSHTMLASMLKPIADSQSTILELMEKFHINLHNVKGGLTEFSYKLTQAADRDTTLLIAVESQSEYTRRYISHKENIGVKEAAEKYSEIVRENRRLTESGS